MLKSFLFASMLFAFNLQAQEGGPAQGGNQNPQIQNDNSISDSQSLEGESQSTDLESTEIDLDAITSPIDNDIDFENGDGQNREDTAPNPITQEQELFDQLESLNFEEASFYEAYRSFIYSPGGRLSPFSKPASLKSSEVFNDAPTKALGAIGLKAYDIQALKVTSLIWDVDSPRALVLDPSGQSHRVEVGTELGRNEGYVAKIREGELIVIEKQKVSGDDGTKEELFRTQVLKMAR